MTTLTTQPELTELVQSNIASFTDAVGTMMKDPVAGSRLLKQGIQQCDQSMQALNQSSLNKHLEDLVKLGVAEGASAYQQVQNIRHPATSVNKPRR